MSGQIQSKTAIVRYQTEASFHELVESVIRLGVRSDKPGGGSALQALIEVLDALTRGETLLRTGGRIVGGTGGVGTLPGSPEFHYTLPEAKGSIQIVQRPRKFSPREPTP